MIRQDEINYFQEIYQLAKKGDEASIKSLDGLLNKGVCINEMQQGSPFINAAAMLAKEKNWAAVELLKRRGADEYHLYFGLDFSDTNSLVDPKVAHFRALGAVLAGNYEYAEQLRIKLKLSPSELAVGAAFNGHREYAEQLRALGANIDSVASGAALGGHQKYVEELRALGAKIDTIANGYSLGGHQVYAEELRLKGANPLAMAAGAAKGGHFKYAEELRLKFNLNATEIAIWAIKGGHLSYAEELRVKHKADIDKILEEVLDMKWINYEALLRSIKLITASSKTAPFVNQRAAPISQAKLQISREVFSAKLKELTNIELSDDMLKVAYNYWMNPGASQLVQVPAGFLTQPDNIVGKLMKFKSDDILHAFFPSTLINKFTEQEQLLLKEFRFIVHGTKRADSTITPVYRYSHSLGARGKPEIELTFIQLYALFNYLLYFHVLTVEDNNRPVGYLHGNALLEGLSDQNPEIKSLRVEFIPPQKQISIYLLLDLLERVAALDFDCSPLQDQNGKLPNLPLLPQAKLDPLRFTQFFQIMKAAITACHSRFLNALTIVHQEIAACHIEEEKISDKIALNNTINTALQQLNINGFVADDKLYLPKDNHQKQLFQCLLQAIVLSKKISGNNQIASQGKKPLYDKETGKGEIIEDNSLFYWRLKYSCQSISDILDIPEIQVLVDNFAYSATMDGKLAIYSESSPHKIVATCKMPQFDSMDFAVCPPEVLPILASVVTTVLNKRCAKVATQDKKNHYRECYQNASTTELLTRYNQMAGICFIRKLRLTEDSDGTNPLHAFLKKYDGEHILPASLIKKGLVASTYVGAWQSCAGILILPSLEEEQLVAGFKRPANSNQLKGIHIARSRVGSALQATGGKPYYSFQAYLEKLFSMQQKATYAVEDKDSLELIGTFVTGCRNFHQNLLTSSLNQQLWSEIETAFKTFLSGYVALVYGVSQQATDKHSVYQETLKKFQTKFLNRVGKNANTLESLYKQIIGEKIEKANKRKYAKQTMLLSEVLLQINLQKRSLDLGDDEEAVIRELLIERCGEVVAVFVQMNVASIADALTIGEALKAYHGEGYEPIYVVLDERHLLDVAGMEMAIQKTGMLAFKSESDLLQILTQADISKDIETIKTEIKARIATPEGRIVVTPPVVSTSPSSSLTTAPIALSVSAKTSPVAPAVPLLSPVAKASPLPAVTTVNLYDSSALKFSTLSSIAIRKLETMDLSNIKIIVMDSVDSSGSRFQDKVKLIFKKCPEAAVSLLGPNSVFGNVVWSECIAAQLVNRNIIISLSAKFVCDHNWRFYLQRDFKTCKTIKLFYQDVYDTNANALDQLMHSLPQEVHCMIPFDSLKGCRDIKFQTLTVHCSNFAQNELQMFLSSSARIKRLSCVTRDLTYLVKSMPFSDHGPIVLETVDCEHFLPRLPKIHSIAVLELDRLTHHHNLGDIVLVLESVPLKPTVLLSITSQHLPMFRSLTVAQARIFKELVSQRIILFVDKVQDQEVYKNFRMIGQLGETRGRELMAIVTDPANNATHLSYEDLIKTFIARQRELEQRSVATGSRFSFLPPPATTASAASIPAQISSSIAIVPAVTAAATANSGKRGAPEGDASDPNIKRPSRRPE